MPIINGALAAGQLLKMAPLSGAGLCLKYCWLAYKAVGATSANTYGTAYSAWQATTRRHTDTNPPAGAAVWFGRRTSDGNMLGDVCISVGGGNVACTDYPFPKAVGICSIETRRIRTGRQYLGWTEDFLGNTVVVLGDTSSTGGVIGMWTEAAKQTFLASVGLDTGGIGNGWGPASIAATKTFQSWVGLDEDGDFGPLTIGKAEVIKSGGKFVERSTAEIQTFLKITADNVWGPQTSLATYRYQAWVGGLVADAKWGAATDAKAFPPAPDPAPGPVGRNATNRPTTEVQTFLQARGLYSGAIDGDYGPGTTAAVIQFQASQSIDQDGVWGQTSDGLAFPPAGSIHGVDYSFARPDPALLVSRGVRLVGRYLWPAKYASKGITRAEYDALRAHGIDVFFIYEEDGKELVSREAGVRVATAAEAELAALGLSGLPIFFNVDYDASGDAMPGVLAALEGIASVIGLDRTGLYAGYGPIKAAFDAGKIRWGFQTYAWSGGQWDGRAQLQQWSNGQWGGSVDFTRAVVPEFGQHPVVPESEPEPDPEPGPDPEPEPSPDKVLVDRSWLESVRDTVEALLGAK